MSTILSYGALSSAYLRQAPGGYSLGVLLEENDNQVRQQAPGFDGMERPFALVPFDDGHGGLTWQRFNLTWSGTDGHNADWDVYANPSPPVLTSEQAAVVEQNGIALGEDTNVGTLWMQGPGQNLIPSLEQ